MCQVEHPIVADAIVHSADVMGTLAIGTLPILGFAPTLSEREVDQLIATQKANPFLANKTQATLELPIAG